MNDMATLPSSFPPYSNRGVTMGAGDVSERGQGPVFDAYCATVRANPLKVLDYLEQALIDAGFETKRQAGPPVRFYGCNMLILDEHGDRLLSVRYGGRNNWPFVEAKGPVSPFVADLLRAEFPHHSPSRIDSALDLRGPEVFAELHKLALQFQAKDIRLDYAGAPPEHPNRGTTIYLGSRKSQAFLRIYQKGLKHAEELGLAPDAIPDELRHWVRVELELKPDKGKARTASTALSPKAVWGCSPWIRDFAKASLSIDAERVHMREKRETNHSRAMRYLALHYGAHIIEDIEQRGSPEAMFAALLEAIGYRQKRNEAA